MKEEQLSDRRDKARPVKVYLTPAERTELEGKAAGVGLPLAVYLRNVGLAKTVTPVLDYEAINAVIQLNADQGRLGGLLKLWLVSKPGEGAARPRSGAFFMTSKPPK